MLDRERSAIRDLHLNWIDLIWLVFLGGLALLPPVNEIHKQLILLAIFVVQLFEGWLIARLPKRGPAYSVIIKILLATLLLDHTGDFGINSSYYPIYFLPVVSAAIYFGTLGALAWTTVASLAYLSLLYPALQEVDVTPEGIGHPRHPRAFLLCRGDSGQPLCGGKPPAGAAAGGSFGETGRNQSPVAPRRSRRAPRRAPGRARATLRRPGA